MAVAHLQLRSQDCSLGDVSMSVYFDSPHFWFCFKGIAHKEVWIPRFRVKMSIPGFGSHREEYLSLIAFAFVSLAIPSSFCTSLWISLTNLLLCGSQISTRSLLSLHPRSL